jgi:hypothetical protein
MATASAAFEALNFFSNKCIDINFKGRNYLALFLNSLLDSSEIPRLNHSSIAFFIYDVAADRKTHRIYIAQSIPRNVISSNFLKQRPPFFKTTGQSLPRHPCEYKSALGKSRWATEADFK